MRVRSGRTVYWKAAVGPGSLCSRALPLPLWRLSHAGAGDAAHSVVPQSEV